MSAEKRQQLTRREFLKIAGGVTGSVLLAACAPAATPQVVEKVVTPTPVVKKPATLKLWVTDRSTINDMTKNFMMPDFVGRNPHIKVTCEFMPEQDLMTKLNTTAAAGNPPDVASADEQSLHILIAQGVLQPMPQGLLDVQKEMGPRIAAWYKMPVGNPNGKFYSVPNGTMTSGIYYNEAILKKYGYTWKDIPKKWDDFIKWAQTMTVWKGDELQQTGFAFHKQGYAVQQTVMYQRGGFYFKNAKETLIRDPVVLDSYQFMVDMYDKYKLDSRTSLLCRDMFQQGKAATACSWTWWNGFLEQMYASMSWGTVPFPTFTGQPPYTRADDDVSMIVATPPKDPDRLEAAWTLWSFLIGPEYQRQYSVLRGVQPARISLRSEERFSDQDPHWRAVAMTMAPGNFISEGIWANELNTMILTSHENILAGTPIKDAVEQTAKRMEQVMPTIEQPLLWGKEGLAAHPEFKNM
jgi:ABC-type glycerol-3-phosphate transport system substrate-binding protein